MQQASLGYVQNFKVKIESLIFHAGPLYISDRTNVLPLHQVLEEKHDKAR